MKTRMLLIATLSIILLQGPVFAQVQSYDSSSDTATETRIYALQYSKAQDLVHILETAVGRKARFAIVESTNSLLVTSAPAELKNISALLQELDVPSKSAIQGQPILCRVYMIELPSTNQGWHDFAISVTANSQISSNEILKNINSSQLRIKEFNQSNSRNGETFQYRIRGQATSCQEVERFTQIIPDSQINQLTWEDDTVPAPIVQVAPLPENLSKHIDRLLGKNREIVGYWFGNLSIPGSVQAPIGPWYFDYEVEYSGVENMVKLNLRVEEINGDHGRVIMGNTMQAKIGHPVIIGYNRNSNGETTAGALVVIPEPMPNL